MDEEFQKKLFQKFVQEDKAIARKYGGTGLGMTISKQLVELMEGTISVESEKNIGTTINVNLPFLIGKMNDLPTVSTTTFDANILIGKSILLVEDNELNRLVACEALSHYQVNVTEAENGKVAIDWLNKRPFDIILMDVQMPELDGLEATTIIRNELKLQTPIIALTANAIKGESEKCIQIGMNDFISKPFEEEDLVKLMAKWLENSVQPEPTTTQNNHSETPLFNLDHLIKISRGNQVFIQKMITLFINQIPDSIDKIQKAYELKDFEILKTTAHKIKPIIDNLGIAELHDDIRTIELLAHEQNDESELPLLIEKVCFTLNETIEQLKSLKI
jgi:CheY-like chemotaxis protein/HPt (histidine-containing phosphotransfer) domain-containing protein